MPPPFLPGLDLARALYTDAVAPLLSAHLPETPYAAALIGPGSEVLGLDTERSTDHDWGPRLHLFLADPGDRARVRRLLADRLPDRIRGWPTRFVPAPGDPGVRLLDHTGSPEGRHGVEVADLAAWCGGVLGFDPLRGVGTADWLAAPTQRLGSVVGGAVFHDPVGDLTRVRRRLSWYPDDVWRYVLACQWRRVAQVEPFVGRCAEAGDDLGARVVAAGIVRDLLRLALLLERRYPPYPKWLGSAFARLPGSGELTPLLTRATEADLEALARACALLAERQNRTGLAAALDTRPRPFHSRPYPVLDAERFTRALLERVHDPALRGRPPVGSVDQYVDNADVLARPGACRALSGSALGAGPAAIT
ncbi:uncharacterized protein DUF4037 [Nocardiopsis sp. Huas11]|uniref:DUF4037 domain-containing protein n=1 Tax=Nocardiopsis sp. Huas11 TaxID=2183912 RepID=UPI000EB0C411|nr:DUF4037 domain-containing protein [Nocardiopsis sp. Huas11]RKS06470.1 uncharacterized protein DUF4037 [Nocardiopsis sp. Huas11]